MKNARRYFIVAAVLVILITVQFRDPDITGPYKGVLGNVLNPCVHAVSSIINSFSNVKNRYIWLVNTEEQNQMLHLHVEELGLENSIMSEQLLQLDELNKLLQFKDAYNYKTIAANVISRNNEGYIKHILIDRGSVDELKPNQPVVTSSGLVGRVSEVYLTTSKVILLYHHESNVSVMNRRTRAIGMLKGDSQGGLKVDYYDRLDNVVPGDRITTSGMGQLYPKGIEVGVVKEVKQASSGLFQEVLVNCSVDFYKLERVLVVTSSHKQAQHAE